MAGESEDPELAAERLEAALERIAAAAARAQADADAARLAASQAMAEREAALAALAEQAAQHDAAMEAATRPGAPAAWADQDWTEEDGADADAPPPGAASGTNAHAIPDPAEAAALVAELDAIIARLRSALGADG
ncbi:MAG: hypothetical protein KGL12_00535 [Rhodospirillales bacterium]|nr:hypothetical protein [Rhodospirillales bacterium]